MRKIIFSIVGLFLLVSCSQEPAVIVYKGQNFYGKNLEPQSILHSDKRSSNRLNKSNEERRFTLFQRKKKQETTESNRRTITIKAGDTLYDIARDNKIPLRSLIEANSLEPPYRLYPGDKLFVPKERNTHIVKSGENLSTIASNYGVSSNDITSINNISNPNLIGVGTVLVLPYGAEINANYNDRPTTKSSNSKIRNLFAGNKTKSIQVGNAASSNNGNKQFIYPVNGKLILDFGQKKANGAKNDGINIAVSQGTPVKATANGKIVYVGNALKGYGNLIIIKHDDNYLSAYAHNDEVYVTKGKEVKQGEIISTTGKTGNVSRAQLYFGLRKGKKALNPRDYLK